MIVRSRPPLHRRVLLDTAALRYWVAAACAATLAGSLVADAADRADEARASWGSATSVLVVAHAVDAGDPLEGAVQRRSWPRALVPSGRVRSLPEGARATIALDAGTALSEALVRNPGATTPQGWRITLALPEVHLPVAAGDRVDIWVANVAAPGLEAAAPMARVARGAVVIDADDAGVTVAVKGAEVGDVARAAATAPVVLVAR